MKFLGIDENGCVMLDSSITECKCPYCGENVDVKNKCHVYTDEHETVKCPYCGESSYLELFLGVAL